MSKPFFSIIIPTLNEEKYLPKLLSDLAQQTFDKDHFEVIHIDGKSDDQTLAVSKKFANKLNIKSYLVDFRNVAYQRNFGAKKARGEWLIFMDADDRLPNYFLDGIKYQITRRPADIYTCWMDSRLLSKKEKSIVKALNLGLMVMNSIGATTALGAMIIAHSQVFSNLEFSPQHKVAEDALFVDKAIKQGYVFKILREPRYTFSFRRLNKEGTIKMVVIQARLILNYLAGDKFTEHDFGYVMKGGSYYEENTHLPILKNLANHIKKATHAQFKNAKRILAQIDMISDDN